MVFNFFQKNKCPYCKKILEKKLSRKKACLHCGKFIFVRTKPSDRKQVLVTKEEADRIDAEWREIHGTAEIFRGEQRVFAEMKEKLRKQFNGEPSDSDVQWALYNQQLISCAQKMNWESYRMIRFGMGEILEKEGKIQEALKTYLEVLYIDQNGPSNCELKDDPELLHEFPPFDPKMAFTATGVINRVRITAKKIKISLDEIKKLFIRHNQQIQKNLKTPLTPEEAWGKTGSELKKSIVNK